MGGLHGIASVLWVIFAIMVVINIACVVFNSFNKGDKK